MFSPRKSRKRRTAGTMPRREGNTAQDLRGRRRPAGQHRHQLRRAAVPRRTCSPAARTCPCPAPPRTSASAGRRPCRPGGAAARSARRAGRAGASWRGRPPRDIATVGRWRRSSGAGGCAEALQQLRAGHQQRRAWAQVLDHQAAAVVQRRRAPAARRPRPPAPGRPRGWSPACRRAPADAPRRKRGRIGPIGGLRQRHRAGDAHGAARLGLHLRHRLVGRLGLLAHGDAVAVVDLAGLRSATACAWCAAAAARPAAPPARRRGATAWTWARPGPPGRRETAAVHHLGEEEHVVQVLHRSSHGQDNLIAILPTYQAIDRILTIHSIGANPPNHRRRP